MSSGVYHGDQPTMTSVAAGATVSQASALQLDSAGLGGGKAPVYLFTSNVNFVWHGQTLSFRTGVPYQLDPTLLAALQIQRAPIVAA